MRETIRVLGVGLGLAFATARRSGRGGFRVALVARTTARLDPLAEELKRDGIDVLDPTEEGQVDGQIPGGVTNRIPGGI